MAMTDWDQRAFCKGCGARDENAAHEGATAIFANKFRSTCKSCGAIANFEIYVARWAPDSVWWWPPSWFRGHWEKKEADA